ncbi:MAG: hypothetical protein ACKO96_42585, partial [Flammeovirgaceae bacterium]
GRTGRPSTRAGRATRRTSRSGTRGARPGATRAGAVSSHEFGHVLQARIWGNSFFYGTIVPASIQSADRANNDYSFDHMQTWTEWTANWFSYQYFGSPSNWNHSSYPIQPSVSTRSGIYPPMSPFDFYSIQIPKR